MLSGRAGWHTLYPPSQQHRQGHLWTHAFGRGWIVFSPSERVMLFQTRHEEQFKKMQSAGFTCLRGSTWWTPWPSLIRSCHDMGELPVRFELAMVKLRRKIRRVGGVVWPEQWSSKLTQLFCLLTIYTHTIWSFLLSLFHNSTYCKFWLTVLLILCNGNQSVSI